MNIVQFLPHDRVGFDQLRMIALFPNLITAFLLVCAFDKSQQFQKSCRLLSFQKFDDAPRRVGFEAPHVAAQIIGSGAQVQMIFQNDITLEPESGVLLQKPPGLQDDIDRLRARKQR